MTAAADTSAVERTRALLRRTAEQLAAAGARDEALGAYEEPKPLLGVIHRPPMIRSIGRAWRLGALLLQSDGAVWTTGISTRVAEPGRPQHHSASVEVRRAHRAAAMRGGFLLGDTVNHGITRIALDASLIGGDGPLFVRGGTSWVRWGGDAPVRLERYLADLADLLLHPPEGT